ncbi:MAG TPA: sodium:proton antiporter [Chthoniobacterales bacterium]|jgi:Na+/H+ antiporter NhaD/arsenite permease-like protein
MFSFIATAAAVDPAPIIMLPFAVLLLCIAFAPLILKHHWERHYHTICAGLAAITASYYIFVLHGSVRILQVGFEYFSFMVVVGSLFVVTGGIHIVVKGEAKPWINTLFLGLGGFLANFIGTTGASMLLIRPWIRMNRYRFTGLHLAFFIFIVSNVGGALLPTGPPLFLGYLRGVPFWWALQTCWLPWLIILALLLAVFYFVDRQNYRRAPLDIRREATASEEWCFDGLRNIWLMLLILFALVAIPTGWRELVMIAAALIAYVWTPGPIYKGNDFTFEPIKELGWLFLGIFGTMVPVLDYMELHARNLGLHSDLQFFWFTGILSGILDNAPTYLTFLAGALGLEKLSIVQPVEVAQFASLHAHYLIAVSLGATCFGALTYIGNGPNLMVKAIADHSKLNTPSFFGYILRFALPVLVPILGLIGWIFFHR